MIWGLLGALIGSWLLVAAFVGVAGRSAPRRAAALPTAAPVAETTFAWDASSVLDRTFEYPDGASAEERRFGIADRRDGARPWAGQSPGRRAGDRERWEAAEQEVEDAREGLEQALERREALAG